MGYILVFLVCHSPRLMLNIYELFTIRQAMECQSVGLDAFPLWPQVSTQQSCQQYLISCSYQFNSCVRFRTIIMISALHS